jgi:hypothetical protein
MSELPSCIFCDEAIGPGDRTDQMGWRRVHWECAARQALGSVGHQRGDCDCFGGHGSGDPPGMTRRQAAAAALDYARMHPPVMKVLITPRAAANVLVMVDENPPGRLMN